MSYTINPNAKNKWARNAENTMDLSIETDASSVYLDDGRTLEQEFGEDSMVSNVATVNNSMSKVIDGTLDGVYESGVMYGRSLVNNNNNKFKEIAFNATNTTQAKNYALLLDNVAGCPDLNITMVAGKKYLILEKWTISSTTGNGHTIQPKIIDKNGGVTYFSGDGQVKGIGTFILKRTFIPTVDVDKFYFAITNDPGVTVSGTFHYGMIIEYQEGMENWDIPYFTGLCDVKMPILRNVGKNLSDGKLESGRYAQKQGVPFPDNSAVRTINKIKVKPSTKYCLRTMDGTTIYNISEYHDGTYIGYKASGSSLVFTTSPTTNELHISFKTNNINLQYQLEEGSIATAYEDHKTNILHTPEIVTLRSLPNGVRDELNLMTGEYIKRIGEVVLNGSESWARIVSDTTKFYTTTINNTIVKNAAHRNVIQCDKKTSNSWNDSIGVLGVFNVFGVHSNGNIEIRYDGDVPISTIVSELQSNPITVQYELETPVTTKVVLTQSEPIVKIGTELPNGVCDTYNLLTGEHIQRVGKVVLDGSEDYELGARTRTETTYVKTIVDNTTLDVNIKEATNIVCNRLKPEIPQVLYHSEYEGICLAQNHYIDICLLNSHLASADISGAKQWLKENPTTIYYELANPIVTKKNGLPNTYGITLPNGVSDKYNESTGVYTQNVGKIVLEGNEGWRASGYNSTLEQKGYLQFYTIDYRNVLGHRAILSNGMEVNNTEDGWDNMNLLETFVTATNVYDIGVRVPASSLTTQDVDGFKKWLQSNPVEVYHQLATPKIIDIPLINVGQVLPNGICDTYNPITKEYVKRVSQGALDGTEGNWILASNALTNTVRFATLSTPPFPDAKVLGSIISNLHFGNELSYENDKELIEINSGKDVVIRISRARLSSPDLDGFKKWIKKNPLTVWYELENPTTLTVDLDLSTLYSSSPIAYENGHIILESGHDGQSLLPTLEYSTITNRAKQIESISEQVLRQEKQLTMLEQMLIQNIINLDYNNTLLTLKNEMEEML